MYIAAEIIIIATGIIGIIGNVLSLLGLLVSGQRTATHIYISYMTVLTLIQQLVSPAFHHYYVYHFYQDFNLGEFLTVMFFTIVVGFIYMLILLFLMDYIKIISTYKFIVIIAHFTLKCAWVLLYYFVIDQYGAVYLIIIAFLLIYLSFHLMFILHADLEFLRRRKQTNDHSKLRHFYVLTFISLTIVTIIIFLLENSVVFMFTGWPSLGITALGLTQLYPVFYFIVLYKLDNKVSGNLLGLFNMCSFRVKKMERHETLLNEDP